MTSCLNEEANNSRKTEGRKKMSKFTEFLLLVTLWSLVGKSDAWSYPVADTIRYPLDSYVVGANHFGAKGLVREGSWHLGDDTSAVAGTNVYAIGAGIVRHAQYHAPYWKDDKYYGNYGGMYIIEHNVNGDKVCALYVHMNFATFTKSVGQEVAKGEYLGQVGNRQQNGDFPVHFHFGIRKGEYPANPNEYVYRDWIFSGYTANESVLDNWYNPSTFIAQHQVYYGDFSEGVRQEPYSTAFEQCAVRNNGEPTSAGFPLIGYPVSDNGNSIYVHTWDPFGYYCQNVERKNSAGQPVQSGIMMYVPYLERVLYIGKEFWKLYATGVDSRYGPDILMGHEANGSEIVLGLPVIEANNGSQRFEGGYMQRDGGDLVLYSFSNQEITRIAVSSVTISLTPSFTAYALSDTQAYVSSGPVSGGVTYRVLRNGTQAGTLGASYSPITNYPHQLQAASKPLTS